MRWRELWDELITDHSSRPAALVQRAAEALAAFAEVETGGSLAEVRAKLAAAARDLLKSHVTNGPLVGLLNRAFLAYSSATETDAALASLREATAVYARELVEHQPLLDRRATAMIPSGVTVITHGYSAAVARALIAAHKGGKSPQVICTESRPYYQGRALAAELGEAGLPVTLIIDAAVFANFGRADMALIGCDSLSAHGLVGRIGAGQIAHLARTHGMLLYVICHTSKIWPADLGAPILTQRPASEVWPDAPAGVTVQNHYYAVTSWKSLSGVVTERGLITADEAQALSREKPVHAELLNIVGELRKA